MPRPLVYLIYNLLLPIFLIVGFPAFILKGIRRGGLARNFRQRLGRFREGDLFEESGDADASIWIHAVSVGEVFLALKAIEALQEAAPDQKLLLSVTTTTGFAVAREQASPTLKVIHNPIDLPWITARVIRKIQPKALVLIEAEVWPNLVAQLHRRNIPIILANARLSPRSARRYARFRSIVEPIFSQLTAISVPFESDVPRWEAIGISQDRIQVLGSVKFDSTAQGGKEKRKELEEWLRQSGCPSDARILLAGSTHDGEEKLLAEEFLALREEIPGLALVIVPRHAERAGAIVSQLDALSLHTVVKVPLAGEASPTDESSENPRVWIANTTGELRSWFSLAEVVMIGKSFCGVGGQNPVEPILAGKPVIVGPHMENFADVVRDLREREGILQLPDEAELRDALRTFFLHPEQGATLAEQGRAAMTRHEGASARTAEFVLHQIESKES